MSPHAIRSRAGLVLLVVASTAVPLVPRPARAATLALTSGAVLPAPSDGRRLEPGWLTEIALRMDDDASLESGLVLRQVVMNSLGATTYAFPLSPDGVLRSYQDDPDVVRSTAIEAALRRSWGRGRWQVFSEVRGGLAWLGWHTLRRAPTNDRRPDPVPSRVRAHGLGATTSAGAGVSFTVSRRVVLVLDGAACSTATDGVAQPVFPLRGTLAWTPPAREPLTREPSTRGLRMSLGAGTSWPVRPREIRDTSHPDLDWSVTIDKPWSVHLSFVLTGAHEAFTSREPFILRQETDPSGNLVFVRAERRPSWAITSLLGGVECRGVSRALSPYASLSAGIARTGGQGLDVVDRLFVVDPVLGPTLLDLGHRVGFGDSRLGFASRLTIGVRHPLGGSLAWFAEAGTERIFFQRDPVTTYPARAGIVLR